MKQSSKPCKSKKRLLWIALLAAGLCLIGAAVCWHNSTDTAQSGNIRKAEADEVEFFEHLVLRNVSNLSEEELKNAVYYYMNEVNAMYLLGSEMGLCEPFDFDRLQKSWESENAERASKRETGEVYYGPDSFALESYFPYQYSALHSDIITKMLDERDDALIADARQFYDQNPEYFTKIISVTYQDTIDGETSQHTITSEQFRFYGQSDPQLMDFLASAQDGEETQLSTGDFERTVKRLSVATELLDFEDNERTVVEMFLNQEGFNNLLNQIRQTHEVVF